MAITINRPAKAATPAGILGYDLFQTAYVTNDLDRAIDIFRKSYHVTNWTWVDGGPLRIALAWLHGHQIEVIQTKAEYFPLYDDWIDKAGSFVIRHHHFGYFVHSEKEWQRLRGQLHAEGRPLLMDVEVDTLKVIYVAAPELGHFLEFVFPNEAGKAFFESIAAN